MSTVASLEAEFKTSGVQEVKNGFAEIAKAAKATDERLKQFSKDQTTAAKSYAAVEKQKAREIAAAEKERVKAQQLAARETQAMYNKIGAGALIAAAAVTKFGVDSYKTYQEYAGQVRDLSKISGTGAKETSTLIQVLDDYQISAEQVTAATRFMTKQGLAPTIETLAKLSDQYNSLTSVQEKNAFVLKNLGRGGMQWINVLNQGSDAILANADDVNKWLIMTDEQIKNSEKSRLAIDALSDAWEGIKVQTGAVIGGMIVESSEANKMIDAYKELNPQLSVFNKNHSGMSDNFEAFTAQMNRGAAATDYYQNMVAQMTGKQEENLEITDEQLRLSFQLTAQNKQYEDALEQIDKAFGGVTSTTNAYTVQSNELKKQYESGKLSLKEYNSEQGKLDKNLQNGKNNLDDVIVKFKNTEYVAKLFNEQVQELNMSLRDGSITQQEYARSISQLNTEYSNGTFAAKEQKKAVDDVKQAQLDAAESSVSALLEQAGAENLVQQEWALATGQITQDGFEQAQAIDAISKAIAGGMGAEEAAAKLKIIIDQIKFLDGKTFTTFMDIVITGDVPKPPARTGQGGGRWGGEVTDDKPGNDHAGGQLGNGWTLVGDAPGGALTPFSELISPSGYVYNAKQTQKMLQSGSIKPVSRALGGELEGGYTGTSPIKKSTMPQLPRELSGTKINPRTGEAAISQMMTIATAAIENVSAPVINGVSQQMASTTQMQILKTTESIRETKKTNDLLEAILAKVASDRGIAYAVSEERYKNS